MKGAEVSGAIERTANSARTRFDQLAERLRSPAVVVAGLAVLNAIVISVMARLEKMACGDLPVRIIDLELTFSVARFNTLLNRIPAGRCRELVQWNFLTLDVVFPVLYALGLCAAFLWAERNRRYNVDGTKPGDALPLRNQFFILAPLAAGIVDIVFENIPLFLATTLLNMKWPPTSQLVGALVWIGSSGAAVKWALVLVSILAIAGEVLSCARGVIIRRLRFSVIAVLLGALPLLIVPQGQDILQRVIEGDHPGWRIAGALAALTFAAQVVWYCGRKLVQIPFPNEPDPQDGNWYQFFAEQIPRMLGIAVLSLAGAAFARAGTALVWFALSAGAGYVAGYFASRWMPKLPIALGRIFVHGYWKIIDNFDAQIGRAVIAVLVPLAAFVIPAWVMDSVPQDFWLLRLTAWLLLVVAWGFFLYVYSRRGRIAAKNTEQNLGPVAAENLPAKDAIDFKKDVFTFEVLHVEAEAVSPANMKKLGEAIRIGVLTGLVLSIAAIVVFTFWPVPVARALGALAILCLAVSSVVFYGSIAAWASGRFRIPAITIGLVFAALFSIWNENHVIRRLPSSPASVANRPDIMTGLRTWRDSSMNPSQISEPVILVAAQGGGLRAAYWTATSLAAIQGRNQSFNRHLFAISGVSGGSLGAAVYSAIIRDVGKSDTTLTCMVDKSTRAGVGESFGPYHDCVRSFMGQDFLSPVLAKMVAPDFLQVFIPVPVARFDRSIALEESWEKSYSDMFPNIRTMSEGFLALSTDTAKGVRVPAMFLNTTHVETGKRYLTTSLVRGDLSPPFGGSPRNMRDARDLLDVMQSDLPLSAAVHNSARFTYVSPPGRIQRSDSAEYGHLVDGGYFENSGLATLREILEVIRENSAGSPGRRPLRPIVLYLCNDPLPCKDDGARDTVLTTKPAAIMEWLGPIRALLKTRDARGSLARAEIADMMGEDYVQLNVCDSLFAPKTHNADTAQIIGPRARQDLARERVVSPPLGWLLSRLARDWMDASLTPGDGRSTPSRCRERNQRAINKIDSLLKLQ